MSTEQLKQIYHFHCPRWSELPEEPMLSRAVIDYINTVLAPIMNGSIALTATMIQNYSKWGYIPKSTGRKYNRKQIANLIVITVYKHVLDIKDIKNGIDLQLKMMKPKAAYNRFAEALESALSNTFQPVVMQTKKLGSEIVAAPEQMGINLFANAFALRLLGLIIIKESGYKNL